MNSALLKSRRDATFWKAVSDVFTEYVDESALDYFFSLQDVFYIKSDDEVGYCREMSGWDLSRQNEFLNACLKFDNPEVTDSIRRLI